MSRWNRGSGTIDDLLAQRHLDRVTGAAAVGDPWLRQADRKLNTAKQIVDDDPESAFCLAYDAARFAGTALLAQQGLRPTQAGGHTAVSDAVRDQFGGSFAQLGTLRRRRNELEYPAFPGEQAEPAEAKAAIAAAEQILSDGRRLIEHPGLY
ncbi:hypothetical protein Lesp02_24840 [Lentzea sp. NBRC 105346]|uniref:HEPN domain-containing protein n=1 Tax=Lentzea sp. NBRC 105346 TaxID=3032205 RepID=UPI002552924E|nr:HEPN domain-containing protein [Lentzea sp. NBRC 105346]GLZ30294.1 hypothetical protein Lesp02_24840 [Lentzea sp. NBRC 105346]